MCKASMYLDKVVNQLIDTLCNNAKRYEVEVYFFWKDIWLHVCSMPSIWLKQENKIDTIFKKWNPSFWGKCYTGKWWGLISSRLYCMCIYIYCMFARIVFFISGIILSSWHFFKKWNPFVKSKCDGENMIVSPNLIKGCIALIMFPLQEYCFLFERIESSMFLQYKHFF